MQRAIDLTNSHWAPCICSAIQRSPITCGICAKKVITGDTITADIIKLADLEPDELLYWSHDNRAMSHLPYMIILDKLAAAAASLFHALH